MPIAPIFCENVNWTAFYTTLQNLGLPVEIEQGIRTEQEKVKGVFCEGTKFNASWDKENVNLTVHLKQAEDGSTIEEDLAKKLKRLGAVCLKSPQKTILHYDIPTANLFASPLRLVPKKTNYHGRKKF